MYRLETFKRGVHMKLLIVEDDVLLSGFLEDALEREGHQVCGTAANVQRAVALARQHRPDVVILDFQLGEGELGSEVPQRLAKFADGIGEMGFLYVTGGVERLDPEWLAEHPIVIKPYTMATLAAALKRTMEIAQGTARSYRCRGVMAELG